MRKKLYVLPALAIALVLALAAVPRAAFAEDGSDSSTSGSDSSSGSGGADSGDDNHNSGTTTDSPNRHAQEQAQEQLKKLQEQRSEAAKQRMEAAREKAKSSDDTETKKNEAFKKACDNRADNFKNRLENIGSRAQTQQQKIDAIVQRVTAFKESKNLDVANYDALLADVNAKKQVVADLVTATQQAGQNFTCGATSDEAKANLATFKDALQQQINAMKDYRTAVKNLIVAVKTAAEAANGGASNEQQ